MEKGQLDFLCLTEAWHKGYCALSEAHPPGYGYMQAARSAGHGGGSAVIHRQDLELSLIYLPTTSSYECLAFKCKPRFSHDCCPHLPALKSQPCFRPRNVYSHNPLYHLCQYHNPGRSKHHDNTPSFHFTTNFLQLLDTLNLQQHADTPSCSRGNTLDLDISNASPISNL